MSKAYNNRIDLYSRNQNLVGKRPASITFFCVCFFCLYFLAYYQEIEIIQNLWKKSYNLKDIWFGPEFLFILKFMVFVLATVSIWRMQFKGLLLFGIFTLWSTTIALLNVWESNDFFFCIPVILHILFLVIVMGYVHRMVDATATAIQTTGWLMIIVGVFIPFLVALFSTSLLSDFYSSYMETATFSQISKRMGSNLASFSLISFLGMYTLSPITYPIIARGRRLVAYCRQEFFHEEKEQTLLFLRPFAVDGISFPFGSDAAPWNWRSWFLKTPEDRISFQLRRLGSMVAIGRPGEELPPIGFSRRYTPDKNWQQTLKELLSQTQIVLVHIGISEGLIWEVEQVIKHINPERLILFFPGFHAVWDYLAFQKATASLFPKGLPLSIGSAQLLYFNTSWDPKLLEPGKLPDYPQSLETSEERLQWVRSEALRTLNSKFIYTKITMWRRIAFMSIYVFLAIAYINELQRLVG